MHAVSANCTSRTKGFPARRRDRRPRRPMHVKAYPNGKDRHIRSLYEFADPFFLFIPNAAGRGQAAAPTAKTGVRCDYLWKCQNPPLIRRDPSSVSAPQDDAPSGSGLRAARNHLPRRGRQGRPTVLPPAGEAPAKRVMRENVGSQQAVEKEEAGGTLPHLSAALTSSPAGGGTYPSVTTASCGDTSPCRGGRCVAHSRREGQALCPIPVPVLRKADRLRGAHERKGGRPMVGPTLGRPTNLEVAVSGCTRRERSPDRSACLCP